MRKIKPDDLSNFISPQFLTLDGAPTTEEELTKYIRDILGVTLDKMKHKQKLGQYIESSGISTECLPKFVRD